MAEAILRARGGARFAPASAGSRPAARVHPLAVEALADIGVAWEGRVPQHVNEVAAAEWDIIITVCDNARETCPVFPGHPMTLHWSLDDPAEVSGPDELRRAAFARVRDEIAERLEALMAEPLEQAKRRGQ
jgi:arsenate reductase